jgi:hypothetical protein
LVSAPTTANGVRLDDRQIRLASKKKPRTDQKLLIADDA